MHTAIKICCIAAILVLLLCINASTHAFRASFATTQDDTVVSKHNFHTGPLQEAVDSILVVKRFRHMYVFNHNKLLKVYKISLGEQPLGPKHFKDDRKTPEGVYHIIARNPNSEAHKSLRIDYPNDNDRQYAKSMGRQTGGDIMIHGLLNGEEDNADAYLNTDWTWGCIAVNNQEIDELYAHVVIGAPINIQP